MTMSYLHKCDRCNEEARSVTTNNPKDWHTVTLPTGIAGMSEYWLLCTACNGMYQDLVTEHIGRLQAFVVGRSLKRCNLY